MLKVGVLGLGNCGSQVAALANEKLKIPVYVLNTSANDLEMIPKSIPRDTFGGKGTEADKGAGKDRDLAKKFASVNIHEILMSDAMHQFLDPLEVVFIVGSAGGGTGSGTAPMITDIISDMFPEIVFILVGVLPDEHEALGPQTCALEYLDELKKILFPNISYMLYDNDKRGYLTSSVMMETINAEIVEDIDVIRGSYNYATKFNSIDDQDMLRIITFPGRIFVARLTKFKEKDCDVKDIEEQIIDKIKFNDHVEFQRSKEVKATGIITNLSQTLNAAFNTNIEKIVSFIGEPSQSFIHTYVNDERTQDNNVFLIISGSSYPMDRENRIIDRIKEAEEKQNAITMDDIYDNGVDIKALKKKTTSNARDKKISRTELDLKNYFNKFGVK